MAAGGDTAGGCLVIVHRCADSSIVISTYTNNNGEYAVNVFAVGCYYVTARSVAFSESVSQPVTIDSSRYEWQVPLVQLTSPRVKGLQEVVVTDRKRLIENKIDRTIFNVNNLPALAGANAMDALQQAPGVKISDDVIGLVAKNNVKLMINDRMVYLSGADLINYIKSIPADNIASIEIITMPPARYDAEGNTGIINIRTKKDRNEGLNSTLLGSFTKATNERYAASSLITYKKGRYTVYGNFSFSADSKRPHYEVLLNYPQWNWLQQESRTDKIHYGSYEGSIDYSINKLSTVSFSFVGSSTYLNLGSINTIDVTNLAGHRDSSMFTNGLTTSNANDGMFNLNYQWNGANKNKFTLNADYFYHHDDRSARYFTQDKLPDDTPTGFAKRELITSRLDVKVKTLGGDYEHPLLKGLLSTGFKLTFISNVSKNNIGTDSNITEADLFNYEENTQALYGSWKRSILKKWELQVSLRGEYTQIKGVSEHAVQNVRQSYARLFPGMYLLHTFDNKNMVSLSYSRRINRPSYNSLNPFKWYTSAYAYSTGNPFLQPSYNHNVELKYGYKGDHSIGAFITVTENGFAQVTNVQPDTNLVVLLYRNFLTLWSYGLNTSQIFQPFRWWQSTNYISVYRKISNSSLPGTLAHMSSTSAYLSMVNTFVLNSKKTATASINSWYQFPEVDNYNKFDAFYNVNVGFRYLLFKNRLSISLASRDLFKTQRVIYRSQINGITRTNNNYYDTRNFSIAISFKFGAKDEKKKTIGNNQDEIDRTR